MQGYLTSARPWPKLGLTLLLTLLLALGFGAFQLPWQQLSSEGWQPLHWQVLLHIRLPRILMALLIGAALAISGAAMQGLFRNPLADPGLLGVASGAALGAAVVIVLLPDLGSWLSFYAMSLAAFGGGLLCCWLIFKLARQHNWISVAQLLLAGIAINALVGSATGFLTYLSDDQQLRTLTFWAMGSLGGSLWPVVGVAASLLLPCCWLLQRQSHALNLLLLGEQEARLLGLDSERAKRRLVWLCAACVGVCVACSGLIGFIGLMVPHLARLAWGADHRLLLPSSALLGAVLLLLADTLARTLLSPQELPVGLLTSLLGGPFFLWLLLRQFKEQ